MIRQDKYDELRGQQEASLLRSTLREWCDEAQVLDYGAIIICRGGNGRIRVNFSEWTLHKDGVITVFPNDMVSIHDVSADFEVEMLRYSMSLLREASLQLEQTVYSALRADRCRQDTPIVSRIINAMFALLQIYFEQTECACLTSLVLQQLKAFFIGFHEYLQRTPEARIELIKSHRVRDLFSQFMMLIERNYKHSRNVSDYAQMMNITPKYLTNIVRTVTKHTPKSIIDQYVILQIKLQLRTTTKSVKELAWEYNFTDVSFFCRYFKQHTGKSPLDFKK